MNIFFTCKNTLVILLQLYRLYVVQSESKNKRSKKYNKKEVPNISIISRGDMYKDVRVKNSRDDNRHKRRRDKDIEANYSETENSMEDIDKFDLSPKKVVCSKRLAYLNYFQIIFIYVEKELNYSITKNK